MRKQFAVAVIIAALAGTACTGDKAALKSPGAADVDTAAIRKAGQSRMQAISAGDVNGYLAAYADDAVWMPPNIDDIVGKAGATQRLAGVLEETALQVDLETVEQAVLSPDWVLERGRYTITRTPKKGGDAENDVGSYLTVWKRQADQSFKIAYDTWHSDRPPVADKE